MATVTEVKHRRGIGALVSNLHCIAKVGDCVKVDSKPPVEKSCKVKMINRLQIVFLVFSSVKLCKEPSDDLEYNLSKQTKDDCTCFNT